MQNSQLVESLRQKDKQMSEVIQRAEGGCLNLNTTIREQIQNQQTVLDRVVQDMEEQRDALAVQINASVGQSEANVEKEMKAQITKINENLTESMKKVKLDLENKQNEYQL